MPKTRKPSEPHPASSKHEPTGRKNAAKGKGAGKQAPQPPVAAQAPEHVATRRVAPARYLGQAKKELMAAMTDFKAYLGASYERLEEERAAALSAFKERVNLATEKLMHFLDHARHRLSYARKPMMPRQQRT